MSRELQSCPLPPRWNLTEANVVRGQDGKGPGPRGRLEDNAFDKTEDCDTVYLIGRGYMSYSDLYLLGLTVSEVRQRGKAVVVALPPLSTGVSQQMRKMLPDVKFIELPDAPLAPFA